MRKEFLISRKELFVEFNSLQNSYTLLIIAINTSAIGYAVSQISDKRLSLTLSIVLLAIIAWMRSIYSSMKFHELKREQMRFELEYLDLLELNDEELASEIKSQQISELRQKAKINNEKITGFYSQQNIFLLAGVVLYIIWAVLDLFTRTLHWKVSLNNLFS